MARVAWRMAHSARHAAHGARRVAHLGLGVIEVRHEYKVRGRGLRSQQLLEQAAGRACDATDGGLRLGGRRARRRRTLGASGVAASTTHAERPCLHVVR
eukprot:7353116-Prymnesium_polylepis.1